MNKKNILMIVYSLVIIVTIFVGYKYFSNSTNIENNSTLGTTSKVEDEDKDITEDEDELKEGKILKKRIKLKTQRTRLS